MANNTSESILFQITQKLVVSNQDEAQRSYAATVFALVKTLESTQPTESEFGKFLVDTHDVLIRGDSSKRSLTLRTIRYCLISRNYVKLLLEQEFHWTIVTSLEKDGDFAMERMQALKLIEKVQSVAPDLYPIAFARSLVAISNFKEDSFRKVCLDSLRSLALISPALVTAVDGFAPLMDVVIEPICPILADSILLTFIYLLNTPGTR